MWYSLCSTSDIYWLYFLLCSHEGLGIGSYLANTLLDASSIYFSKYDVFVALLLIASLLEIFKLTMQVMFA
jgi:hypothetical protein